jgi:hypothetical protein
MCIVQKVIHKDEIEVQALSLLSPLNEGHTAFKIIYNDISFIERNQIQLNLNNYIFFDFRR